MKETNLNNIKEKKMERENLPDILHEILKDLGGRASMMDVFKNFWKICAKTLDILFLI